MLAVAQKYLTQSKYIIKTETKQKGRPTTHGTDRLLHITRGLVNWPLWTGYSGSLGSALVAFVERLKRVNVWTVRRDEEE